MIQNSTTITNPILRRILRLDEPLEVLSAEEAERAQHHNFRWNLFFNAFDVIFFMGGVSILSATTILPLFVSKLTNSALPLALIAMLSQGGFALPQLLSANFVERIDHKKIIVVNLGFFTERVPVLLLVFAPLTAVYSPTLALVLFLLLYAWFNLGGGIIAPAWQELVARCFPVERRGRFFGGTLFFATLIGIGAAAASGRILERFVYPINFAIIFAAAAVCIMVSWLFLAQAREPIEASEAPPRSVRQYFAELPVLLRHDRNFRNFLGARTTLALAEMGSGFLTVAALQTWQISDGIVALFTMAMLVGQTTGSLLMGFVADRLGHRLSLEIASGTAVLSFGLAWFAPHSAFYYGVFFLLGFFNGARTVSGMMVVLEFAAPQKRPTYVGIANTLIGVGSMVAPLLGAVFVQIGYEWAFAASTLTSFVALLLLRFTVHEPRFYHV